MKEKKTVFSVMGFLILLTVSCYSETEENKISGIVNSLEWKGLYTISIKTAEQKIYIDPVFNLTEKDYGTADMIIISHGHDDNFWMSSINRLTNKNTLFVMPEYMALYLTNNNKPYQAAGFIPGDKKTVRNITIEAVPAYDLALKNTAPTDHPRQFNWLGYIITIDGVRIYYTGGTQLIPEMKNIKCDILIGNLFLKEDDPSALATLAEWTGAKAVIPTGYGPGGVSIDMIEQIRNALKGKATVIVPEITK